MRERESTYASDKRATDSTNTSTPTQNPLNQKCHEHW